MSTSHCLSRTAKEIILNRSGRLKTLCVTAFLLLFSGISMAQSLTVSDYTAVCPNQVISVTASWPNTNITSLNLYIPTGGSATNNGNLQTNTSFTISHPGPPPAYTSWTLVGTGLQGSTVVTNTFVFHLSIYAAAPLTFTNQVDYCPGGTATIITDPGGNYYTVVGPQNLGTFPTNVFIIPNLGPGYQGIYTVTSIGTCTMTGTTQINIAPSNPLTVNNTSNVCQGQNVYLTAGMPGSQGYQWYSPSNVALTPSAFHTINGATVNDAGVYRVEATQQYGNATCIKTATTQVNVVATNPVIASASPNNHLCQNDKLSLTANAGVGVAAYQWKGPSNFSTTIPNPTISPVTPQNSGDYTVTAYFTNNFVTCTTQAVTNISVVPTAVPNPSVPATVCQDSKVQLSVPAPNNISVYQWVWYGPNFSSNVQNPAIDSIKPSSSGPYVVTAIYTLPAITKTCAVSSSPHQLSVIAVNTVAVIPPKPVCIPENAYFAASSPGAVAYEWKGPNNVLYSGANMTLYYPPVTASGVYTVTAFFGSLNCPSSNTAALKVNSVLNFSLTPDLVRTCFNLPVTIPGPSGADTYTWTSSTGYTSNSKDLLIPSAQTKDAGTYTLSVNLGQCISKSSSQIEVYPPVQFTLTPKSRTICLGDTVILEVGLTGGTGEGNYAFEWNPPLYLTSPTGSVQVVAPLGTVNYNITAWDVVCRSKDVNYFVGHNFEVKVLEAPTPTLLPIKTRACDPFCQFYGVEADSATGITTFDLGGLRQFQTNSSQCLPGPGEYTLNITTKGVNGCVGHYTYPYPIIVDPRPGSEIIWNPNPANTSENIKFTAQHENNVVYQSWLFQGGQPAFIDTAYKPAPSDTTQDLNPVRRYDAFGQYPVMLVTQNEYGCWDTIYTFVEVIDIMSVYIPDAFTPNGDGINDVFKLKGQGMEEEGFSMYIFNRKGQVVFSTKDIDEAWDGTYNGVKCQDGVYTYKVRVVGMNGEGRRERVGKVTLIK